MIFENLRFRIGLIGISLLICLSGIQLLHGTFVALVITIIFQVYLPGYLLARVLKRTATGHVILSFAWILLSGLALTISLGAIARVLSLSIPIYLLILHMLMFAFATRQGHESVKANPQWRFSKKKLVPYALVLVSCLVAMGVNYESRNRFYGFEDQSIFISLIDWIATHPNVRPHNVPILSRQIGIINGDIRMATDGWTFIQAAWVWTSGVSARQLVWYDLSTLFIWTVPLIHFALAYELTKRKGAAVWTTVALALAALMTLDNVMYNPTYTAYGRFVLFQINVNRQASITLMLPLALIGGLTYLQTFRKSDLCITILAGFALASMHPIPTTIFVFSLAITALLKWLSTPQRVLLKQYIPLGVTLAFLMALPLFQRYVFFGTKPALNLADLTDVTKNTSTNIVFLPDLPLLGKTYIRRPSSVFYSPIIIATTIIGLLFGIRWRRNIVAQYIFGTTLLGLTLFFTPGIPALIDKFGSFITLLSLMFILPVSLALGLGIELLLKFVSRFILEKYAQTIFGVGIVLTMYVMLFEPFPILGSARDQIRAFNNIQTLRLLHPSQSALMENLRTIIPSDSITVFMTPSDIGNVIIEEVPGVLITGGRDQGINTSASGDARFYTSTNPNAPWLDTDDLRFMKQFGVTHIIMLADSTRLPQMLLSSDRFTVLNTTDGYTVFQINQNIQHDMIDDLYVQMNNLYAGTTTPRWQNGNFNLVVPGSPKLWSAIKTDWETILKANPNNDRARLGLAYTYMMMGEDHESLALWKTLNNNHADVAFYADAEASSEQILDPSQDSIRPLIDDLGSGEATTRVLAARRLLTDTFFYRLSSEQLEKVFTITDKDAVTWDRLANFDQPNNVRKRAALIMARNWARAKAWLETIPQAERSPEDILTIATIEMAQNKTEDALNILKPVTDSTWLAANIFLHPDRWQNNVAAQTYYLLLGEREHRNGHDKDALIAYQMAREFGSAIAAPYFMSQIVPSDQATQMLDDAKAEWAKIHHTPLPHLISLSMLTGTSNMYVMQPIIERDQNEHTIMIRALYGNIRPQAYPILNWRIQVVSPDSTTKYAEIVVPAQFVDGALVDIPAQIVIPEDVPELTPALVYIEPRFNNVVTTTPVIMPIVLNRPNSAALPTEADHPDLKFGSDIVLKGYTLLDFHDHLDVTLYWQANTPVPENYQVFVHVIGADNQQVDGQDSSPVNNRYPTNEWRTNLIIADQHIIPYSKALRPGVYTVEIGLYRLSDGTRITITPRADTVKDNALIIGQFKR